MSSFFVTSVGVAVLLCVVYRAVVIGSRPRGLPPGPDTLPLLGNIHLLHQRSTYLQFTSWARQYGGIYSLMIASQPVVVITSPRVAHALVDKRSATTSDRPPSYMADLVTNGKNMIFSRDYHDWKLARSIVHRMLTKEAVTRYEPIQRAEATQLMYDLLVDQERFFDHTFRSSYSIASAILAGVRSPSSMSPSLVAFAVIAKKWSSIMEPGAQAPVDVIPVLKYLPERWAKWKTLCRDLHTEMYSLYESVIVVCEHRITQNKRNGSLLESMLDDSRLGSDRALVRGTLGAFLEGASETTTMFLRSLILMLVAFPEVQTKAQKEIDALLGAERAPLPSDFEQLPYVQAIVKEVLRIRSVVPLGVPHYTTQEEIIDGYVIPQNTTIILNQYGMLHDPDVYDDPHSFNPDRFLQSSLGVKPGANIEGRRNDTHYGGGRRICVGMHLANNTMAWNTMNFLWAFNFKRAVDPVTKDVIPVDINNYSEGITTAPNPFKCNIEVRSQRHAKIIQEEFSKARSIFEAFEYDLSDEDAGFARADAATR